MEENNSTSYEPSEVRARSCSSSVRPRGDGFSAFRLSEKVMRIPCPLLTFVVIIISTYLIYFFLCFYDNKFNSCFLTKVLLLHYSYPYLSINTYV